MSVPHTVPHTSRIRTARPAYQGQPAPRLPHRERDTTVPLPLWDRPLARAKCSKLQHKAALPLARSKNLTAFSATSLGALQLQRASSRVPQPLANRGTFCFTIGSSCWPFSAETFEIQ
jgi:hypothetical protein